MIPIIIYLAAFAADLVMDILGLVAVAIGLILMKPDDKHLPSWLYLWDNYEDGIDIAGRSKKSKLLNRLPRWAQRYYWLALRNPVHDFAKYYIGLRPGGVYKWIGRPWSEVSYSGGLHIGMTNGRFLQFFYQSSWIYIRLGWYYKGSVESARFCPLILLPGYGWTR